MSEISSAVHTLNGKLATAAQFHTTPVVGVLRDVQARQAEVLGSQVARALSGAARTSSAWDQLQEAFKGYQLCAVRVASLPCSDVLKYRPPTTDLLRSEASPPAVEPPSPEHPADTPAAPADGPQALTGSWTVLQPFENTLYGIIHGPLVVKVLAVGVGQVIIGVIVGGIVYVLFYCC
jgi:hypothetical protein